MSAGFLFRFVRTTQANVASTPTRIPGKKPAKKAPAEKLDFFSGGGFLESMPDAFAAAVEDEVAVALAVVVTLVVVAGPASSLFNLQTGDPPSSPQV